MPYLEVFAAEMNFGRIPENYVANEVIPYEIQLSKQAFTAHCIEVFERFRTDEMNESPEETYSFNNPIFIKYMHLGFPSFENLFENEKELLAGIIEFIAHDILINLFNTKNIGTKSFFLICTIDLVHVSDCILIFGKGLHRN